MWTAIFGPIQKNCSILPTPVLKVLNIPATGSYVTSTTGITMSSPGFGITWSMENGNAIVPNFVANGALAMMMKAGCFIITIGRNFMLTLCRQTIFPETGTIHQQQGLIMVLPLNGGFSLLDLTLQ